MRMLLLVGGLATGVALVSGVILLTAGPSGGPGTAAGPDSDRSGPVAVPDPAAPVPPDLDRRLRDLEAGMEEFRARLDVLSRAFVLREGGTGFAGGWESGGTAGGLLADGDESDPGSPEGSEGAEATNVAVETVAGELAGLGQQSEELRGRIRDLRREAEIRKKIDLATSAMTLQPFEKDQMEEIVRAHVERVEALGTRARDILRESPFGLTPGDRTVVQQMLAERRELDGETEKALVALVGGDRWKAFRKAEKDQRTKERALRRLGQPW